MNDDGPVTIRINTGIEISSAKSAGENIAAALVQLANVVGFGWVASLVHDYMMGFTFEGFSGFIAIGIGIYVFMIFAWTSMAMLIEFFRGIVNLFSFYFGEEEGLDEDEEDGGPGILKKILDASIAWTIYSIFWISFAGLSFVLFQYNISLMNSFGQGPPHEAFLTIIWFAIVSFLDGFFLLFTLFYTRSYFVFTKKLLSGNVRFVSSDSNVA